MFVWLMLGVLVPTAKAEHGPQTWKAAYQSVVIVNPTWPGYRHPGMARLREQRQLEAVCILPKIGQPPAIF